MYTISGIHMLETVAKPMLQMLETQRESSTKRIQVLQKKLEQLSIGINIDECVCDGKNKCDEDQQNFSENRSHPNDILSMSTTAVNERKKEKKSSMVSSPV